MSIKKAQKTITVACGDETPTEISGVSSFESVTLKTPPIELTMDEIAYKEAVEVMGETKKRTARIIMDGIEYEGELQIYKTKENECIKFGARMIAPRIIDIKGAINAD